MLSRPGLDLRHSSPVLLARAAHPRQAALTALGLSFTALVAGRSWREVGLIFATVLVGQAILGWHNDLVDRLRDHTHDLPGKPIAQGLLAPGTVWYVLTCAVLIVVPLAVASGPIAGSAYLISLAVGLLGNYVLRKSVLSWLPWVVSFALYPAFISYARWPGEVTGNPPEIAITVLAGLLGLGIHFVRALPGLIADNKDGWRHLPLRVALKTGAPRLLIISAVYLAGLLVALLATASAVGLSQ